MYNLYYVIRAFLVIIILDIYAAQVRNLMKQFNKFEIKYLGNGGSADEDNQGKGL